MQWPGPGSLLEEAYVVGVEVVQAHLHDGGGPGPRRVGRAPGSGASPHETRTTMRAEPAGGSSAATMR